MELVGGGADVAAGREFMEDRSHKMTRLKMKVAADRYSVDPAAVAEAMLAHVQGQRSAREHQLEEVALDLYSECSYPRNPGFAESAKRTPAAPRWTLPIHVRLSLQLRAAAAAMADALGGTQTHSS